MAKRKAAPDAGPEPDAVELERRDNQRLARIAALAAQADGTAVKKGHAKPLNSQRRRANARKRRKREVAREAKKTGSGQAAEAAAPAAEAEP